jgi:RNA polymerase sigma-70 factor (ECF subfamily)
LPRGEQIDFEATSIAEIVTSPSIRFDRARQVGQLNAALRELPTEQQLLLELHYWYDLDAAALGEVFDTTAGTIRVRLLRARRALREQMTRRGTSAPANVGNDRLAASLTQPEADEVEPDQNEE